MSNSLLRPALVLGLLSCIGPFAIDMYLPAMPLIGAELGASVQAMQGTITAYFIAFGLAQLIYGPWADQAGRKPPLYAGIAIFCLGTLICAMAGSAEVLWAGRFVQGTGAAALMVVPRAIIRDLSTGHEATRMMAAIMLVISVSPMLAPLAGAGLMAFTGWRAIFVALLGAAAVSLALLWFAQPETLAIQHRARFRMSETLLGARRLIRRLMTDRGFLSLTFVGAFGMAEFLCFHRIGGFRLYRAVWPVADRIFPGICRQRDGVHRRVASGRAAWNAAGCDAVDAACIAGVCAFGLRVVCDRNQRADRIGHLHHRPRNRQRVSGRGYSHDDGHGAGRSWRYRGAGLVFGRRAANADGWRHRGGHGTVLFGQPDADDRRHCPVRRCGLCPVAADTAASGPGGGTLNRVNGGVQKIEPGPGPVGTF